MGDSTNTNELKTIATYKLGNTLCEVCSRHELTDEDVERFNQQSKYYNLVKKKRGDNEEKEGNGDDTTEIRTDDRENK